MSSTTTDSDDSSKLLHVTASEMYPKRNNERFELDAITLPFTLLCGEYIEEMGKTTDGLLVITNYRLYVQRSVNGKTDYNIPLGLIEAVEIRDIFHIYISCKDARIARCSFATSEACSELFPKLTKAISPAKSHEELFAFVYYAWATEEGGEEILERLGRDSTVGQDPFWSELERLRYNVEGGSWRISRANTEYRLCTSYPRYLIVPASITDQQLMSISSFRTSNRIPTIVWRNRENGMVIARSSQPVMGWLCWRSAEDEELLKAITDVCYQSSVNLNCNPKKMKLLVMDARSYISATANRARGGGYECPDYYANSEITFMNLPNIHSVRNYFNAIRKLCSSSPDQPKWHSVLEGTGWLQNLSLLMQAASRVVSAIEKDVQPVLVHCSDGWDRTSQIVSLAELLMDPYYRTIQGFQTLCEREWLEFGHKFADRCGIGEEINEKSPIFLQWLDAVHNILHQYPCAFQFSKRYLIKLAEHTYSNLFGTFLCNTSAERARIALSQRTFSAWRYLNSAQFRNYLYDPNYERVLWPKYHVRDLHLWRELYIDLSYDNQYTLDQSNGTDAIVLNNGLEQVDSNVTNNSQEVSEIGNLNHLGNNIDSMLESAINCQPDLPLTNSSSSRNTREESIGSEDSIILKLEKSDICDKEIDEDDDCISRISEVQKSEISQSNVSNDNEIEDRLNDDYLEDILDGLDLNADNDTVVKESNERILKNDVPAKLLKSSFCKRQDEFLMNYFSPVRPVTNACGPIQLDPIDGLPVIPDEIQDRMQQISYDDKTRQTALENELYSMRMTVLSGVCKCAHSNSNITNTSSDKPTTTDDDKGSECSTEVSWEAVEEKESQVTLWMPDHAITNCQSCDNKFWLGRRKHHCRSCGKIFCADCSRNLLALPNEQLYAPVRVCEACYYNTCFTHKQTMTCKQAAADEEIQSSSMLLPPTQPI